MARSVLSSTLPPNDYLIALGAFAMHFNELEMTLWGFFNAYMPNKAARDHIFNELHNRGRVDTIKCFVRDDDDPEFVAAVEHGLKCFDLCSENRNIALHAFPSKLQDHRGLALLKRAQAKPGELAVYILPLSDLQAAAEAAGLTQEYLLSLAMWPMWRSRGEAPPLPDRPPLPRKLSLSTPTAIPLDG